LSFFVVLLVYKENKVNKENKENKENDKENKENDKENNKEKIKRTQCAFFYLKIFSQKKSKKFIKRNDSRCLYNKHSSIYRVGHRILKKTF